MITGPVIKSREEVMELTLTDPGLTRTMEHLAETKKKNSTKSRRRLRTASGRFPADPHVFYISAMHRLINWLSGHLFEGIAFDTKGFEKVRQASQRGCLISCPATKVTWTTSSLTPHLSNITCNPRASPTGENLSFWPLGPIFRGSGVSHPAPVPGRQTLCRGPPHLHQDPDQNRLQP